MCEFHTYSASIYILKVRSMIGVVAALNDFFFVLQLLVAIYLLSCIIMYVEQGYKIISLMYSNRIHIFV